MGGIELKQDSRRFIILISLATFLILVVPMNAYALTITQGGVQIGKPTVTKNIFVPPCNKNPCTDVHFKAWQKEDNINIVGWSVEISDFTNSNSVLSNQPEPAHSNLMNLWGLPITDNPDNGNHAISISADGANIPQGAKVNIKIKLWLTHWNVLRISDFIWTNGDPPDPANRSMANHGWTIDYPEQNSTNPAFFNHTFCMYNDDTIKYLNVSDLAFNTSMKWYQTSIIFLPPYYNFNLTPGTFWCKNISTYDSLIGGHIYFTYNISSSPVVSDSTESHIVSENGTNFSETPYYADTPPHVFPLYSTDDYGIKKVMVSDVVNANIWVDENSAPTTPSNTPQNYDIIPSKKTVSYTRSKISAGTASYRITTTDTGDNTVSACPLFLKLSNEAGKPINFNGSLLSTENKFSINNSGLTNVEIRINDKKFKLIAYPDKQGQNSVTNFIQDYKEYDIDLFSNLMLAYLYEYSRESVTYFIPEYGEYNIDLSPYLVKGDNSITMEARGKPGGSADILISE